MTSDPIYASKCHQLYSILKHACAGGIALSKINAFKHTKDGHQAWQKLMDHYYANGNIQEYIRTYHELLIQHVLTSNNVNGVDTYVSKFEEYCLKLEEVGSPIPDIQKVSYFLNGIQDNCFHTVKTICRSNNYGYEKCVLELRREAETVKAQSKNEARHIKNAKSAPSYKNKKSKVPDDLKLPQELWDTMTDEQKAIYKKGLYTKHKESSSKQKANDQSSDKTKKDKENENLLRKMSLRRRITLTMMKHLTLSTSCA